MADDFVDQARKAGADDDTIYKYLTTKHGLEPDWGLKAGASKQDVIQYLAQKPIPLSGQILPTALGGPARPTPAQVSQGFDVGAPEAALSSLPAIGSTLAEAGLGAAVGGPPGLLAGIGANLVGGGAGGGIEKMLRSSLGQKVDPSLNADALAMGGARALGGLTIDPLAKWVGSKFNPQYLYENALKASGNVDGAAAAKAGLRERLSTPAAAEMVSGAVGVPEISRAAALKENYLKSIEEGVAKRGAQVNFANRANPLPQSIDLKNAIAEAWQPLASKPGLAGKGGAINPPETAATLKELSDELVKAHGNTLPFDKAHELKKSLQSAGPKSGTTDLRRSNIEEKAYKLLADKMDEKLGEKWQAGALGKDDLGYKELNTRASGLIELEKAVTELNQRKTNAPWMQVGIGSALGGLAGATGYSPFSVGPTMVAAGLLAHAAQYPGVKSTLAVQLEKAGYPAAAKLMTNVNKYFPVGSNFLKIPASAVAAGQE